MTRVIKLIFIFFWIILQGKLISGLFFYLIYSVFIPLTFLKFIIKHAVLIFIHPVSCTKKKFSFVNFYSSYENEINFAMLY